MVLDFRYKDPEYHKKYKQRLEVRERIKQYRRKPEYREKERQYRQRLEVKERRKETNRKYDASLKGKEQRRQYDKKPERQEYKRLLSRRPDIKEKNKEKKLQKKYRVYNHYSNYDIKCNCCGERRIEFLSIDHVNNDGYEHRKTVRGSGLVNWIIINNFPLGFQILCLNCNCAKGKDGEHICIHKKEIDDCVFDYQVIA